MFCFAGGGGCSELSIEIKLLREKIPAPRSLLPPGAAGCTQLPRSHIDLSSSSAFGAPSLRYGRLAMTTPRRRGGLRARSLLRKDGFLAAFAQQRQRYAKAGTARSGQDL